jgi:hypothetical protein
MALKETFRTMHSCGIISATATENIRFTNEQLNEHGPFNVLIVWNDSGESIKVTFNNDSDDYVILASSSVFGTTLDDGKTFYELDVTNEDTVNDTASGEVRLRIARVREVPGGP